MPLEEAQDHGHMFTKGSCQNILPMLTTGLLRKFLCGSTQSLKRLMAKTKAEMMKRLRNERKDSGLVEFRVWVKPGVRDRLKLALKGMK